MATVRVGLNERIAILGKTGTGKTVLGRELSKRIRRFVCLDPKGTLGSWNLEPWGPEVRDRLRRGDPVRTRVPVEPTEDLDGYWEEVFEACYTAGNLTIYVDEGYGVWENSQRVYPYARACWTRGRELGIGAWVSSQAPVAISLFLLREAEHFFVFRLTLVQDRQRLAAFMGEEVMTIPRDPHGFYYMAAAMDRPIYVAQLEVGEEGASMDSKVPALPGQVTR